MPTNLVTQELMEFDLPGGACVHGNQVRSGRLFRGTGNPVDALGAFGSIYINTTNGQLWTKDAPFGPVAWTLQATLQPAYYQLSYAFLFGDTLDQIGNAGDYCLVFGHLDSCSLYDASIVGPKLPSFGAPGTWTGATSVYLSTVIT